MYEYVIPIKIPEDTLPNDYTTAIREDYKATLLQLGLSDDEAVRVSSSYVVDTDAYEFTVCLVYPIKLKLIKGVLKYKPQLPRWKHPLQDG